MTKFKINKCFDAFTMGPFVNKDRFHDRNVKILYTLEIEKLYQNVIRILQEPKDNRTPIYVYGNIGIGKSFSIFAVVQRLKQEGKKVFFIQDCGKWASNYNSILEQILIDFPGDKELGNKVQKFILQDKNTENTLEFVEFIFEYYIKSKYSSSELVFVFDQVHSLVSEDDDISRFCLNQIRENFGIGEHAVSIISTSAYVDCGEIEGFVDPWEINRPNPSFSKKAFNAYIRSFFPWLSRYKNKVFTVTSGIPFEVKLLNDKLNNRKKNISEGEFNQALKTYQNDRWIDMSMVNRKFMKDNIHELDIKIRVYADISLQGKIEEYNFDYVNRQLAYTENEGLNTHFKFLTPLAQDVAEKYFYDNYPESILEKTIHRSVYLLHKDKPPCPAIDSAIEILLANSIYQRVLRKEVLDLPIYRFHNPKSDIQRLTINGKPEKFLNMNDISRNTVAFPLKSNFPGMDILISESDGKKFVFLISITKTKSQIKSSIETFRKFLTQNPWDDESSDEHINYIFLLPKTVLQKLSLRTINANSVFGLDMETVASTLNLNELLYYLQKYFAEAQRKRTQYKTKAEIEDVSFKSVALVESIKHTRLN